MIKLRLLRWEDYTGSSGGPDVIMTILIENKVEESEEKVIG